MGQYTPVSARQIHLGKFVALTTNNGYSLKLGMGEAAILFRDISFNLIHVAIKYHKDIPNLVLAHTRIVTEKYQRVAIPKAII